MTEKKNEFGETDRQQRAREARQERKFFNAWWEAYKIALAKGPISPDAPPCFNIASTVEQEFRDRHASMMEAIKRIVLRP